MNALAEGLGQLLREESLQHEQLPVAQDCLSYGSLASGPAVKPLLDGILERGQVCQPLSREEPANAGHEGDRWRVGSAQPIDLVVREPADPLQECRYGGRVEPQIGRQVIGVADAPNRGAPGGALRRGSPRGPA